MRYFFLLSDYLEKVKTKMSASSVVLMFVLLLVFEFVIAQISSEDTRTIIIKETIPCKENETIL